ncbi:MAG: hypothetical protein JJE25_11880 [Bacteroidia bacterium]|nr:hypothetical protein [Bacteroidia bacterium]
MIKTELIQNKYFWGRIILFFVLPVSVFLSFNKHSKDKYSNYHSVIWADAAGYYVYLPIWFIYGNNSDKFPENILQKSGDGFRYDDKNKTVITKYTCGVAILQTPFFLITHFIASPLGFDADGFSKIYYWSVMIAGVFYLCLGLFFVYLFLCNYFKPFQAFLTTLIIFLCTNLYYYSIDNSGMSHVYSFFLFSVLAFITSRSVTKLKKVYIVYLGIIMTLIFLCRPINIIVAIFPFFFFISDLTSIKERTIKLIENYRIPFFLAFASFIIVLIPQLLYWKKISGNYFLDTYSGETFSNWNSPKLILAWFSTNNGLFTYTPLMFLIIIGMLSMISKREQNGKLFLTIFLIFSYIFSSWWSWWFGCAYGYRSFVEYYALFSFPLAHILFRQNKVYLKRAMYLFVLFCLYWNMEMIYYYDGCFYGGEWDWDTYIKLLRK